MKNSFNFKLNAIIGKENPNDDVIYHAERLGESSMMKISWTCKDGISDNVTCPGFELKKKLDEGIWMVV
jgi:hypothetical protein